MVMPSDRGPPRETGDHLQLKGEQRLTPQYWLDLKSFEGGHQSTHAMVWTIESSPRHTVLTSSSIQKLPGKEMEQALAGHVDHI